MTKEIKATIRDSYRPLKKAYQTTGTTFSPEFDKAKNLAEFRMDGMTDTMTDSAFGLWKLGLLPEEELNKIRECSDKLRKFVDVAVEHFRNLEKESYGETAYYSREYDYLKTQSLNSDIEFINLYDTKEAYVENSITGEFDDIDIALEDMLSYFNMVK